ncbi:Flp family type IVb pilin [Acetobacter orientalis]|uniref:Flp family type IVb pilin n=1 Tax=Acetobacter orientalis TaxID=146474 RepID=UPI0039EB826C
MNSVTNCVAKITSFFKTNDKRGVTAIEYGLIAALISVVIVASATTAGQSLKSIFSTISSSMTTAQGQASGK